MNRASLAQRTWYETSVPVFLERFLLPVLAAVLIGVILLNPFKFDRQQQGSLAVAVIALAYFVSRTVHRTKDEPQRDQSSRSTAVEDALPAGTERVSVPENITVEYLVDLYETNTSLQADKLAFNYIGKWMKISATVARSEEHTS